MNDINITCRKNTFNDGVPSQASITHVDDVLGKKKSAVIIWIKDIITILYQYLFVTKVHVILCVLFLNV
jgi:hypothetical protein